MTSGIKTFFSYLFRIALSAALLGYLFHKIDLTSVRQAVSSADWRYIFAALASFFVIHFFLCLRWLILIRALDLNVPRMNIVHYFFVGLFFNLFLPTSTGGDFVKTIGLCRYTDQKAKVVASVVLDRLSGFAGIVVVALIAYVLGQRMINDYSVLISIGVLAGIVLLILLGLFNEALYSFGCQIFNRWPKIKNGLMNMHYDIALLKNKQDVFFIAVGISCLTQLILSLTFYWVGLALHQEIYFGYFLVFVPLVCIISSLPSIGGLGVRDAGAVYLFGKIGIAAATVVSITLINFLFMVLIGLIGGVLYVASLFPGWLQYHQKYAGAGRAKA